MTRWREIRDSLPADIQLVAVSKYHSAEQIAETYASGCRDFGESRVQELKLKQAVLPRDIRWHFIGHLQTNKVRDLLNLRPYLIQSVDSEHLLQAINTEAVKQGIVQNVLLELHVAAEETKSGMQIEDFKHLVSAIKSQLYPNVCICGVMGMATNTDDKTEIRRCFHALHEQYLWLNNQLPIVNAQLSMGMSDDYGIALSEGSTMVRIGSAIFD
ncbi:MAG: YggS family pyridoxal phosphate-dependent enzyme [Paludibacteraceae bacterium]|nr:YggS family pyridoxal phosphate-dependent enzyme [Paludibacteraceae bacterium]